MSRSLLEVRDLRVEFDAGSSPFARARSRIAAVDGVSLDVGSGETLGLVGESGCGKSTLARALFGLVAPARGRVAFEGRELTALAPAQLRRVRAQMQMIFQDSASALDPRMRVAESIGEPLDIHRLAGGDPRQSRIRELLEEVGLSREVAGRYPHELSGGQRQRVAIARALAVEPRLIVADEPVAGLDRSVQAQITNLLAALQRERGLALLVISHDLGLIEHLADRVSVMYLGRIVETAPAHALFAQPAHPYTRALLSARLGRPLAEERRVELAGEAPSPSNPPPGCRLHPRCPLADERCGRDAPMTRTLADGRTVACHRVAEQAGGESAPEREAGRR